MTTSNEANLIAISAEIVTAFVSRNPIPSADLPGLLSSVHAMLARLISGEAGPQPVPAEALKPAVSVLASVRPDAIACLECGKRFASIKRHLASAHGHTPESYRAKWGLPKDYPLTAPDCSNRRSALAKSLGLGQARAAHAFTH